ncbi:non-specific lipid transfer protein GPI-anchored 14-like [Typha latifolia]|uniref:non-specific lipid transfer protein GPI-anchored 14-like n=1 Tax=Typha latifolia TaxID=4733 RepID=UPI003C2FB066
MAFRSQGMMLLAMVVLGFLGFAAPDLASDRAECTDELIGLATCLTYVQGHAVAPTPDCCAGMKHVLDTKRKCLCVLIKDRDDPNVGIKMNVTLAMMVPSLCKLPANISHCPALLNLPPHSKDAEIFEQFGNGGEKNSTSSSVSSDTKGSRVGSSAAEASSSDGGRSVIGGKNSSSRWLGEAYAFIYFLSLVFLFLS